MHIVSFKVTWEKLAFSLTISEILKCRCGEGEGYAEKLSFGFHLSHLFITGYLKSPVVWRPLARMSQGCQLE